ncbi:MAG: hypothetical protein ACI80P_000590 [Flavobacteriales bacterium]|jgi:hypothetical protein
MGLGALRFITLFLLSLFLLHPLIKTIQNEIEDPIIVIITDNSESIVLGKDSTFYTTKFKEDLELLTTNLGENYDVQGYSFGESLNEDSELTFSEKTTNLSAMIDGLYGRYSNRNIGAVIIATDGLFNQGRNPLYLGNKLEAPLYTIALGDTLAKKDLLIKEVANNRLAYLGNKFPIQVISEAKMAQGSQTTVSITHKGAVVFSESWSISSDYELHKNKAILEAKNVGLQKYTIRVKQIDNEVTLSNNSQEIYIDVLESRQRVLVLASAPHPDIAALKASISSNENYEVTSSLAKDFEGKIEDYSLVLFHQIPSLTKQGNTYLNQALKESVPSMIVLGQGTDFNVFNNLKLGYSFKSSNGMSNDVSGVYAQGFPYFQLEESTQSLLRELPPLSVPFGDFTVAPGVVSLVNQRVGNIKTNKPLISFNQSGETKIGVISGDGIWRWRMVSFLKKKSHSDFDAFSTRMVQYMASRNDRRQFKLNTSRNTMENERIIFEAEVYNASYEAMNEPEVSVVLKDAEENEYTYTLGRTSVAYRLDAGYLPTGEYTWSAKAIVGGKTLSDQGSLSIAPVQLEGSNTQANHRLLYQLSALNGGEMVEPSKMMSLVETISNSGEAVKISYERTNLSDLINIRWILALILALLSIEWLVRKRSGSY